MGSETRRKMPKCEAIADYWMQPTSRAIDLMGYGGETYDDEFVEDECWACGRPYPCGYKMKPERCHVVSKEHGGSDDCSNLVLLCSTCHQQSEFFPPETFWGWMKWMRKNKWKNYSAWLKEKLESVGLDINGLTKEDALAKYIQITEMPFQRENQ